jgi:hypothetical protein
MDLTEPVFETSLETQIGGAPAKGISIFSKMAPIPLIGIDGQKCTRQEFLNPM